MSLDTRHPLYALHSEDWRQMRDTMAGERVVKAAGDLYLPASSGMRADGYGTGTGRTKGDKDYNAYRVRARFPDLVDEAVSALLGVMHSKPPVIELPESMEYLRGEASVRGESLEMVLKRINYEQMIAGRLGLLADVIDRGPRDGQFYLAFYDAEDVLNWDQAASSPLEVESLNLVVLDETAEMRVEGFSWKRVPQYRVLQLGALEGLEAEGSGAVYSLGVFRDTTQWNSATMVVPTVKGRKAQEIPFVFINAEDVAAEPGKPPLLGLSNLALTIYRGEADYRQGLFMQGQDTLVVIGSPDPSQVEGGGEQRVGAGSAIYIADPSGDAKYIGVDGQGLPEQRQALMNDYSRGEQFAGKLMDSVTRERESGDALRIRVATRTATLNQIAQAGAYGLERVLRKAAKWAGENPESVSIKPNLDFVDDSMTGEQLRALMDAKAGGAPLSYLSVHRIMAQRSMTELDFDGEIELIRQEKDLKDLLVIEPAPATPGPTPAGKTEPRKPEPTEA